MEQLTLKQIRDRIRDLCAKIPAGAYCTETNCCAGYLTADEENELNDLFRREGLTAERQASEAAD